MFFFLLLIVTTGIYANTLTGKFVSADDLPGIVNNPQVKNFEDSVGSWELEKIYPAVVYRVFGMNPEAFHFFSLTLHFINIVLCFIFVFLLFGKTEAIIATLIFATHPINVETISWISAYGYLIYCFVTLMILTNYLIYIRTSDKKHLIITFALFCAALILYRKPWVALIPLYIFVIEQFIVEDKPAPFKRLKEYAVFTGLVITYFFVYVRGLLAYRAETLTTLYYNDPTNATPYFNRILYTVYMTIKLFLFPKDLTIYHEGEVVDSLTKFTIMSAGLTVTLMLAMFFLYRSKNKSSRNITVLIVLIFVTMLMSFYPEVLVWAAAERYLYLASIFFGVVIALIYKQVKNKQAANTILVILLLIYGTRSLMQTNAWKNSKNLWIATQKVSPYSYRVYNNLGDIYAEENNYPEAIKNFQISLQLSPGFADAAHNLGYTYYQMGDITLAKTYLLKSYEMNPRLYQALYKLGVIAYQEGDINTARSYFVKALQVEPTYQPTIDALKVVQSLPSK